MAELLHELDQFELAQVAYDSVPTASPLFPHAEVGRADALLAAGSEDRALGVLQELAETHSDAGHVHMALGDLLRRMKRYEEAVNAYTAAIELTPQPTRNNWPLFYMRGMSYERSGVWHLAEADFRRALELRPDQPSVLNYLGYSLVEMNLKLDEAKAMIVKAASERPNDGYIVDSLGWVLFKQDSFEQAVDELEKAVSLEPHDPVINDHLGDAYWAVGRKREARFQWKRALGMKPTDTDAIRIRQKLEFGLDLVSD